MTPVTKSENRLVTVGGDTVEVAHEALLREWPRLRSWLEQDAEARRLHRHITLAAREWDAVVVGGVRADACAALLSEFFAARRAAAA